MSKEAPSFRFARREKLTESQDFKKVMKYGKRLSSKNLTVFVRENRYQFHRLGVVVSKDVGTAPYRNRMKRCCREFFRLHKNQIEGSYDIIILARRGCSLKCYKDVEGELGRHFSS